MPRVVNTDYQRYISSPEWRVRRRERLKIDGHKCSRCPATEQLEVHHLNYDRLGTERMSDLLTLCASCHAKDHGRDPSLPAEMRRGQGFLGVPDRLYFRYLLEHWQEMVAAAMEIEAKLDDLLRLAFRDKDDPRAQNIRGTLNALMRDLALDWDQPWDGKEAA